MSHWTADHTRRALTLAAQGSNKERSMTTKDEALKMALDALEYSKSYLDDLADVYGTSKKAKPGSTSWNVSRAIKACREALAQKDERNG